MTIIDMQTAQQWVTLKRDGETWEELRKRLNEAAHINQHTFRRRLNEARKVNALATPQVEQVIPLPDFEEPRGFAVVRPRVRLRTAVVDIETTDLNSVGYQGYMILGCILPLDDDQIETAVITHQEGGQDKRVLTQFVEAMCEYDQIIGHNIAAFDLNWLHSRFMHYGLRWPRAWMVCDTYQAAKTLAIKSYKSLGMLGDYFDLAGTKTSVYPRSWHNVRSPNYIEFEEARDDILYHCEQDVVLNRNVFDALYPYCLTLGTNVFKVSKWRVGAYGNGNGAR